MELKIEQWTEDTYRLLIRHMQNMASPDYKMRLERQIPEIKTVIGLGTPILRKMARRIAKGNWRSYLEVCKTTTYEEEMLKGFLIGYVLVSYEEFIQMTDQYFREISCWTVCDSFCSCLRMVERNKEVFFDHLYDYLHSKNHWTVRGGLVLMLHNYLDEEYIERVLKRCEQITSTNYYVELAQAWLISIAYVKFPVYTYGFLMNADLSDFVYNKTIQKISECKQVLDIDKDRLKSMKRRRRRKRPYS